MSNLLLPQQICRDIPGYEGLYYARTDGKIFSYPAAWTNARYIKGERPVSIANGYGYVKLHGNNQSIHRLVAMTFVLNPFNKPCVNHLDGDKSNNNYWNLAWVTYQENTIHAIDTGLIKSVGSTHYLAKLTEVQVIEIMESPEPCGVLAKRYGVLSSRISSIKYGSSWKRLRKGINIKLNEKPFPSAKLTEEQVVEILESPERDAVTARKYGVSQSVILQIRTGKTWKYITDAMNSLP